MHRVSAILLAILIATGLAALPAQAQTDFDCNAVIVDESNDGVLAGLSADEPVISELESLGANVRIRAIETAPGNIDTWIDDWFAQCSWNAHDIIVLAFEVTGGEASLVDTSPSLAGDLPLSATSSIRSVMNDYHSDGEWVEGVVWALVRAVDNINGDTQPAPVLAEQPPQPSEPRDYSGLLRFVVIGIAIVVGVILFIVLFVTISNKRDRAKQLAFAKQQATMAHNEAGDALYQLTEEDKPAHLKVLVDTTLVGLNPADASEVSKAWKWADKLVAAAFALNGEYQNKGGERLITSAETVEECKTITAENKAIAAAANEALAALANVEAQCQEIERLIAQAAEQHRSVSTLFTNVSVRRQELLEQGYKLPAGSDLDDAKSLLDGAKSLLDENKDGLAIGHLRRAESKLDHLQGSQEAIVDKRRRLDERHSQVSALAASTEAAFTEATLVLHQFAGLYAHSCWADLQNLQHGHLDNVAAIKAKLEQADTLKSMSNQQWKEAGAALAQIERTLGEIEAWSRAVHAREKELADYAQNLGTSAAELERELNAAFATVGRLEGKQAANVALLEAEKPSVQLAYSMLNNERPDLFAIRDLITETNGDIADAVRKARAIQQRIDDERAKAARIAAAAEAERQRQRRAAEQARLNRASGTRTSMSNRSSGSRSGGTRSSGSRSGGNRSSGGRG